jgi:hypothetical protein
LPCTTSSADGGISLLLNGFIKRTLHTVQQQALLFIRHLSARRPHILTAIFCGIFSAPLANRQAMYSISLYRYLTVRTTQSTVQQITFPLATAGTDRLLGAFAKLPRATISFVMYVRPSIRMEQLGSHWKDFN